MPSDRATGFGMLSRPIVVARKIVVFAAMFALLLLATSHSELDHGMTTGRGAGQKVALVVNAPCPTAPAGMVAATIECSTPCAAWLPASGALLKRLGQPTSMAFRVCSRRRSVDLALTTPPPRLG